MQHLDEGTLQAWLDGARSGLDPSKLAEIERHLGRCDACASRADELARSSFRAHALLSVGRDRYAPRVSYEDVAKRALGSRTRVAWKRWVGTAWAASVVGAIGMGWVSNEVYRSRASLDVEAVEPGAAMAATPAPAAAAAEGSAPEPRPASAGPGPSGSLARAAEQAPATSVADAAPASTPAATDLAFDARAVEPTSPDQAAVAGPPPAASPPQAPSELVVRGFVADEEGRPVPAAQVYVAALDVGVLTRSDGRYDLRLPAEPDSFELTVERIGFRQQARAISAGEGDYLAADFRLREEALTLDEIIVTGESAAQRRSLGNAVTSAPATPFRWRASPSIAAEGYVGSDLWTLPGLDVLTLDIAYGDNPNELHVARVRQDLGRGATLTLIQGRTDGRRTSWPVESEGAVLSTWRGEMLITATAPVTTDVLRGLLGRLR